MDPAAIDFGTWDAAAGILTVPVREEGLHAVFTGGTGAFRNVSGEEGTGEGYWRFRVEESGLYRVEVHRVDPNRQVLAFKWSRDNGTVATPLTKSPAASAAVVGEQFEQFLADPTRQVYWQSLFLLLVVAFVGVAVALAVMLTVVFAARGGLVLLFGLGVAAAAAPITT
mgnify:CR=1 FL=1